MKFFSTSDTQRVIRYLVSLLLDLFVAYGSLIAAYLTIFDFNQLLAVPDLGVKLIGFLVASIASFLVFGLYRGSWRYVSIPDLLTIIKASLATVTIFTLGMFLLTRGENLPRSVPVLSFVYMVMGLAGMRLVYRVFLENVARIGGKAGGRQATTNVLLWGSSDRAESFIRAARRDPAGFSVVGMLDDSPANHGKVIQGIKVLDGVRNLEKVVAGLRRNGAKVDELIITEALPERHDLVRTLEHTTALGLRISRIPAPSQTTSLTSNMLFQPRPIEMEDLLERPVVKTDMEDAADLIKDNVVLITGAGGSIGSELSRQIAAFQPRRLVITDSSEFLLYKLDAELRDKQVDLDIIARIVDVRDTNGSVVPRFGEQIAAGGPVTVTHPDIVRYFMTIPEAVTLVLHASANALARSVQRGGIMVLDMGKPVRIADLAERMIQLAGYRPYTDISIVFTGLRPGEKLYEELFDPAEAPGMEVKDGYVLASPRATDRQSLDLALKTMEMHVSREELASALDLLASIVPEYRNAGHARPIDRPS